MACESDSNYLPVELELGVVERSCEYCPWAPGELVSQRDLAGEPVNKVTIRSGIFIYLAS
jgi:hypothetical protein